MLEASKELGGVLVIQRRLTGLIAQELIAEITPQRLVSGLNSQIVSFFTHKAQKNGSRFF